jgi:FMN reductase [NAD(P)H]
MEYYEVLSRRRMHRAFLPDPVPEEAIQRIARSIRRAPSGGYSQGQSVVVVTDTAMRHTIAEGFDEKGYVEETGGPAIISTAPVHLILCVCERVYHERYNQPDKLAVTGGEETTWPVPYWFIDVGAALMLVLMTAIAEGLAATFFGDPNQDAILRDLLDLPKDVVPIGVTLVGYPAEDPDAERATRVFRERRRPEAQVIHRERWRP